MARGEWGHTGRGRWWSCRKIALVVCSINIVVALYVLHSLYNTLFIYPISDSQTTFRYSDDQIRKMEESNKIRKASEPIKLINLVTQLKTIFVKEKRVVKLPQHLKQKFVDEILHRLRSLNAAANATEKRGVIAKSLSSDWDELVEDIGLWIPAVVVNKEHDDKPEDEEEFGSRILPGRLLPSICHAELHTDYDGLAVRWGLTHHKESAYECCMACLDQAKHAKSGENKCNIWVYCPSETGCYSPDIYEHKNQECWLKYSEKPKLNFKDKYPDSYREAHMNAPLVVPWVSGVVGE